jgi:hypothetical protein
MKNIKYNVYKNSRGDFKKNRGYKISTKSKTGTREEKKRKTKKFT